MGHAPVDRCQPARLAVRQPTDGRAQVPGRADRCLEQQIGRASPQEQPAFPILLRLPARLLRSRHACGVVGIFTPGQVRAQKGYSALWAGNAWIWEPAANGLRRWSAAEGAPVSSERAAEAAGKTTPEHSTRKPWTPLPTCRNHAPAWRRSCESGSTNMRAVGAGSELEFYWATDGSSTWTAETGRMHESARARAARR